MCNQFSFVSPWSIGTFWISPPKFMNVCVCAFDNIHSKSLRFLTFKPQICWLKFPISSCQQSRHRLIWIPEMKTHTTHTHNTYRHTHIRTHTYTHTHIHTYPGSFLLKLAGRKGVFWPWTHRQIFSYENYILELVTSPTYTFTFWLPHF